MGLAQPTLIRPDFWCDKRVLVTGHTGFKGGWLSLWLQNLGASVKGLSLAPTAEPNLFTAAKVYENMDHDVQDIRDFEAIACSIKAYRPEIVFHLAAQPLVRLSYQDPVATYATNVMGTVHVLEACRKAGSVRVVVNVTTDKCYENKGWFWGYRENDPLGGHDPYSNSKACAELATDSYRRAFLSQSAIATATARAGNVIGGGDWADDRLVPDCLRALDRGVPVRVRYPRATRPWQHVLEPLSGYLMLAERLFEDGPNHAEPWNFGPQEESALSVQQIVEKLCEAWGRDASWEIEAGEHPHEALQLKLDISKVRSLLGWQPRWAIDTALEKVVGWHQAWSGGADMHTYCLAQIAEYQETS